MGKKNRTKARENRIRKSIAIREGNWTPPKKEHKPKTKYQDEQVPSLPGIM